MRKLRIGSEGEMIDWIHFLCGTIEIFCLGYIYFRYLKLHDESRTERIRLRRAMDYAMCIDDILTGATMVDDKRKRLQTCYHHYLAAIGSGDWDLVAKRRDAMDEALDQSGWEWRVDDRARRPHPRIRRHRLRRGDRRPPDRPPHTGRMVRRVGGRGDGAVLVVDGGRMPNGFTATRTEQDIIDLLNRFPSGMTIDRIERHLGRPRHDSEVRKALTRLKTFGVIRRSRTTGDHLVVWKLM